MCVLVTGANGFLGSFICRELLNEGYKVKALVREGSDLSRLSEIIDKIDVANTDLLDLPTLDTLISGCEYVIHCAAKISFDASDCSDMLENNVESTRTIENLCLK